jgi:hypothetical protein
VFRLGESHVLERRAAVGRLVDAAAPRRALAIVRLAGANPYQVRIRLRDRDVADRDQPLVLELGDERRAVVGGLPDATMRRAYVVNRGIRLVHRQVGDAAGHGGRSDGAEVK